MWTVTDITFGYQCKIGYLIHGLYSIYRSEQGTERVGGNIQLHSLHNTAPWLRNELYFAFKMSWGAGMGRQAANQYAHLSPSLHAPALLWAHLDSITLLIACPISVCSSVWSPCQHYCRYVSPVQTLSLFVFSRLFIKCSLPVFASRIPASVFTANIPRLRAISKHSALRHA